MRGRYKKLLSKLPVNGWHCTIDGYDFKRPTKEELVKVIDEYLKQYNIPGSAEDLVEETFCRENPDQCRWRDD